MNYPFQPRLERAYQNHNLSPQYSLPAPGMPSGSSSIRQDAGIKLRFSRAEAIPSSSRAFLSSPEGSPFPVDCQPMYGSAPVQPPSYKPIFMGQYHCFSKDPVLQAEFAKTPPSPCTVVQRSTSVAKIPSPTSAVAQRPSKTSAGVPKTEISPIHKRDAPVRMTPRVLSGTTEKILKWTKVVDNMQVIFEVIGSLASLRQGVHASEKVLLLKEQVGPTLQCVFYETDRPLCPVFPGQQIRCVGRMVGRNKLQAFCVSVVGPEERAGMLRLNFVCQRAFQ